MRRTRTSLLLCATVFGWAFGAAAPAMAELCRPVMPDRAEDARGFTFSATVLGIEVDAQNDPLEFVSLAIHEVYANRGSEQLRAGQIIRLYSNGCDGFALIGIGDGDRILMSTANLEQDNGPSTWNTAVWRNERGHLRLAVLTGEEFPRVWFTDDRRIAKADTVREALALVAPGAAGMPTTSTEVPASRSSASIWPWIAGVIGLVGCAVLLVWRRMRLD